MCDMATAGFPLSRDELELALLTTDAWVARLVCRGFRDRCDRRDATLSSAVQSAARLELALALGMPRSNVCHQAARGGHLGVLQWARANGCEWDSRTWHFSARHPPVREWLAANGCPCEY